MDHLLLKRHNSFRILVLVLVLVYVVVLFYLLFVGVGSTDRNSYFDKRLINLTPLENTFKTLRMIFTDNYGAEKKDSFRYLGLRNIFGNILLFVPFGMLVPFLHRKLKLLRHTLLLAFLVSLCAETIQFIFKVGVFDVDDVLFNVSGAALGYLFFSKIKRYLPTQLPKRFTNVNSTFPF